MVWTHIFNAKWTTQDGIICSFFGTSGINIQSNKSAIPKKVSKENWAKYYFLV